MYGSLTMSPRTDNPVEFSVQRLGSTGLIPLPCGHRNDWPQSTRDATRHAQEQCNVFVQVPRPINPVLPAIAPQGQIPSFGEGSYPLHPLPPGPAVLVPRPSPTGAALVQGTPPEPFITAVGQGILAESLVAAAAVAAPAPGHGTEVELDDVEMQDVEAAPAGQPPAIEAEHQGIVLEESTPEEQLSPKDLAHDVSFETINAPGLSEDAINEANPGGFANEEIADGTLEGDSGEGEDQEPAQELEQGSDVLMASQESEQADVEARFRCFVLEESDLMERES